MLPYEFQTILHSSVGDLDPLSYYSIFSSEDWQDLTRTDMTNDKEHLLLQMIYQERVDVPCHVDQSVASLWIDLFPELQFCHCFDQHPLQKVRDGTMQLIIMSQGH